MSKTKLVKSKKKNKIQAPPLVVSPGSGKTGSSKRMFENRSDGREIYERNGKRYEIREGIEYVLPPGYAPIEESEIKLSTDINELNEYLGKCRSEKTKVESLHKKFNLKEMRGLKTINFSNSIFDYCMFDKLHLNSINFSNSIFDNCIFTNCDIVNSDFKNCEFKGSSEFINTSISNSNFINSKFSEIYGWTSKIFTRTILQNCKGIYYISGELFLLVVQKDDSDYRIYINKIMIFESITELMEKIELSDSYVLDPSTVFHSLFGGGQVKSPFLDNNKEKLVKALDIIVALTGIKDPRKNSQAKIKSDSPLSDINDNSKEAVISDLLDVIVKLKSL